MSGSLTVTGRRESSSRRPLSYGELLADADPGLADELEAPVWRDKFDRAQAAVGELARRLAQAAPDVVVTVGDDQHELFGADDVPAIGLFTGERLWDPRAAHDYPPQISLLIRIRGIRAGPKYVVIAKDFPSVKDCQLMSCGSFAIIESRQAATLSAGGRHCLTSPGTRQPDARRQSAARRLIHYVVPD